MSLRSLALQQQGVTAASSAAAEDGKGLALHHRLAVIPSWGQWCQHPPATVSAQNLLPDLTLGTSTCPWMAGWQHDWHAFTAWGAPAAHPGGIAVFMGCGDLAVVPPLWFAGMLTRSDSPLGLPQSWPINWGQQACRQATGGFLGALAHKITRGPHGASSRSSCGASSALCCSALDLQGHLLLSTACRCGPSNSNGSSRLLCMLLQSQQELCPTIYLKLPPGAAIIPRRSR